MCTRMLLQCIVAAFGRCISTNSSMFMVTVSRRNHIYIHRRLGKGSTLYLPVKVYGGLLQMGDCHTAQVCVIA